MTNKTYLALYKQGHVLQVEISFNSKPVRGCESLRESFFRVDKY